jgi:very-short-patch-repair endonuclease
VLADDRRPHVAAPGHSGGVSAHPEQVRLHWAAPIVPRHAATLEDSLENALVLVATCQPRESALAVWESALRLGMVDRRMLERLPLPAKARDILACATPFSDSGLETFVLVRLKWMRVRIVPQIVLLGRPVDFLIGERLVLQIDGGHHVGAQREKDIVHDAELMLRGYHVIRVGYRQVVHDWPAVQEQIMRAVAQGLHLA